MQSIAQIVSFTVYTARFPAGKSDALSSDPFFSSFGPRLIAIVL